MADNDISTELELAMIPECECKCYLCREACREAPCWGTPLEIENLMSAGYGDKLMAYIITPGHYNIPLPSFPDAWNKGTTTVIAPAKMGGNGAGYATESTSSGITFRGRCVFLRGKGKNELCEIHGTGLKPVEGRVGYHDMSYNKAIRVRELIISTWNTDFGRRVAKMWVGKYSKYKDPFTRIPV